MSPPILWCLWWATFWRALAEPAPAPPANVVYVDFRKPRRRAA